MTRELLSDGNYKHDSYLAHTDAVDVALMERARVAKAEPSDGGRDQTP